MKDKSRWGADGLMDGVLICFPSLYQIHPQLPTIIQWEVMYHLLLKWLETSSQSDMLVAKAEGGRKTIYFFFLVI